MLGKSHRSCGLGKLSDHNPHAQVSEYAHAIEDQENQVLEMNSALNSRNPTFLASSYEFPAFNLLRLELEGAQELVAQLKTNRRVSGVSDLLHELQSQVCGWIKESFSPSYPPVLSNFKFDSFQNHFFLRKKILS